MDQVEFYENKLQFEIDAWDLNGLLQQGGKVVVVDTRSREAYAAGHIPGALSMPHREMSKEAVALLAQDALYVAYCDGIGCNASTKGALNLTRLGFIVKELLGGLDWWKRDGYPVAVGREKEGGGDNSCCGCG